MKLFRYLALLPIISITVLAGCKKESGTENTLTPYEQDNLVLAEYLNLPDQPFEYDRIDVPDFLDKDLILTQDNTPPDNPVTNEGATLGRVLFYDTNLSKNNTIACASCHIQQFAFSDTARFSKGFEGGHTRRHSMGLSNARFRSNGRFFWDERAETLEDQVLMPIQDPVEMGMTLEELELKLAGLPYYPILFKRAFGDETITSKRISKALAQFVRSMLSFNSKYDQGRKLHEKDEPFSNFTQQENMGKSLFFNTKKGLCGACHFTDAMVTDVARNNGLTGEKEDDEGAKEVTGNPMDYQAFKAPSLRNIAIRPPYLHSGAYPTLRSVIETYSTGIQWSPALDAHLQEPGQNAAKKFNLTDEEIDALIAFLHTLTDESFLKDERFGNPF